MVTDHTTTGRLAVRNTLWLTIGSYAVQVISFGAMLVLVRLLTPEIFGFLSIGLFWSSLLSLSPKVGLNFAAIRQGALSGELLGTFYRLELALAASAFALSVIAAVVLISVGYSPTVALVLVITSGAASASVFAAPFALAVEKEMQLSRLTILSVGATIISYAMGIALAYAGAGIWSLLAMNIITTALNMLNSLIVCRWRLPEVMRMRWTYSSTLARVLIKQGLPVGMSNVATTSIVNQYDNFLIGTYVSPTMLGFYDRAYRISQWPNNILTASLVRVAFLTLAKVKDDLARLTHTVRLALWLLTTLGVPIALFIFFGAPEIVGLLYGPAWSQSGYFLRFLAIFTLISPYIALVTSLAVALGHRRVILAIPIAQAFTLIVMGTPLTWQYGANGTILGVAAAIAVGFIISSIYLFRQVTLTIISTFGGALIAITAASITSLLIVNSPWWDDLATLLRLGIIILSAPGVYMVVVFALRPMEMIERLRYVLKIFRRSEA